MNRAQLAAENAANTGPDKVFNVTRGEQSHTVVTVGKLAAQDVTYSLRVTVPVLTNDQPLAKGDELLFEVQPPVPKKRKEISWKDGYDNKGQAKAPKTKAAPPAPKPGSAVAVEV